MNNFLDLVNKNSYEIDKFLNNNLPNGNGLDSRLFEAMRYSCINGGKKIRAVSYTHLTLPTTPYV